MKVSKFFEENYTQSALYQSFRSIANYVDGLKPSSRKVIYTVEKNNIDSKIKVSQLMSKVSEQTQYLHGEQSLYGVIVGLAANYIGSNNLNLLEPSGNFGCRFVPDAAASRYIYTHKSPVFDYIFKKEDSEILIQQEFEGEKIEPQFYVPVVPLILVNGSSGIGNGFSQLILPRDIKEIIIEIKNYLKNSKYKSKGILPSFKNFKGKVRKNNEGIIEILGHYEKENTYLLKITEIPIGVTLNDYLKILNKLVDNKVIRGFKDKSENDKFEFEINIFRDDIEKDKEKFLKELRLIDRVTENFTCIDENNKIIEFKDEVELLEHYIKIRLQFYEKRKQNILNKLQNEIMVLKSKAAFIAAIVLNKLSINNRKKEDIEKDLEKIKNIVKIEGGYDYLFKLNIYNLTKEKIEQLKKEIEEKEKTINELKQKSIEQLWIEDLNALEKIIK